MTNHYPPLIRSLPTFDGPFEAYQLNADDSKVLFASYPAGTVIKPHTHDTDNVGIITQGELILTMDGKTITITPGNWYHVPAHKTHSAVFEVDTSEIEFWFEEKTTSSAV